MIRTWLIALLILSMLIITNLFGYKSTENPTGAEDEDGKAKTAVAHVEQVWLNALNRADVNRVAGILADDFCSSGSGSGSVRQ